MARFGSGGPNAGKRGYGSGGEGNLAPSTSQTTSTNSNTAAGISVAAKSNDAPPSSNDASWTPPLWLQKGKHAPRPRSLAIPIPPVPLATRKAIQKAIARQRPAHYKQQTQMQQLQIKLQGQTEKLEYVQQRLQELEESKVERIQEIKVSREEEMEAALQKIKDDLEKDHAKRVKEQEEEWKETTERELKAAKRQFKKDQAELEESELETEKQKLEEAAQQQQKKEQELELQRKGSIEDGELEGDDGAEEVAKDDAESKPMLESEKLEREHNKVKEKLDNLKETKKEMVWLLKQVINAENKRKVSEASVPKKKLKL